MRDSRYKHSHSTRPIKRMHWGVLPATANSFFSPPLLLFVMKHISEETHNSIVSLLDTDLSSRKIEAQLSVSRSTINKVRANIRPGVQKGLGGRPAKITATDKHRAVRMVTSGKADN